MVPGFRSAFLAYPGSPTEIGTTILAAAHRIDGESSNLKVVSWPNMDVFGAIIPEEVRDNIRSADVIVCDVTRPNLNVYYEAGFAIGRGKTLAPIVNSSFAGSVDLIRQDGIFDNIGYQVYENSDQLFNILTDLPESNLVDLYARSLNFQQPLYVLDTLRKTDFRNAIVSAVKSSKVFYRSFDPVENARFSTISIIAEITSSSGVVIPILGDHIDDATKHNLRASFLAGLSHGLNRETLMLAMHTQDPKGPTDYKENVVSVRNIDEIDDLILKLAREAQVSSQSISTTPKRKSRSRLQRISLGASAAENEFRTLENYFVETAEYLKTIRGDVRIVAGRKGSGKTAIFFQARDKFRKDRKAVVTDLKPESHQLSLFREELLKIVDQGVFDHTLAAFWQFVILSEVLLTIRWKFDQQGKYDSKALAIVHEIDSVVSNFEIAESGDFTTRINHIGKHVIEEIQLLKRRKQTLTPERLTNIVFKNGISEIRQQILKHSDSKSDIVLLFDNIDKGWASTGVHKFDIRLVRLLIETLDKIRRDLSSKERKFVSVVFLRNDVYELLVDDTPDRGKSGEVRIDWTDRAKLRRVIFSRLQASSDGSTSDFEELWHQFFVSHVDDVETFEYFLDHCLMRPRFLITIVENAIANAINRGHPKVAEDDCIDAVRQHSNYLVSDFGYEIRDVSGLNPDILYSLIGVNQLLTREEVLDHFRKFGLSESSCPEALDLMLWYGVLGIGDHAGESRFIYDYDYIKRRLDAELSRLGGDELFVVNPAIHVALSE